MRDFGWLLFFLMIRGPPRAPLFPSTSLFPSVGRHGSLWGRSGTRVRNCHGAFALQHPGRRRHLRDSVFVSAADRGS